MRFTQRHAARPGAVEARRAAARSARWTRWCGASTKPEHLAGHPVGERAAARHLAGSRWRSGTVRPSARRMPPLPIPCGGSPARIKLDCPCSLRGDGAAAQHLVAAVELAACPGATPRTLTDSATSAEPSPRGATSPGAPSWRWRTLTRTASGADGTSPATQRTPSTRKQSRDAFSSSPTTTRPVSGSTRTT